MDNVAQQLDQALADMQGTADEARELIKEAEKRWYYLRSPSEESAVLAGQIALGNERLNLLNQWIEKISAIRAAVGGVGETVAWWREDHVCHAHELTTADALADGYKPCVIKCEDCAWNASLCDTHGAVGGEAVATVAIDGKPGFRCVVDQAPNVALPVGMKLYASPPATVDVGALRELANEIVSMAEFDVQVRGEGRRNGKMLAIARELAALIGKEA